LYKQYIETDIPKKHKKIHSRTISAVFHTADLVFAPTLACWKVRS